jgi:hypothetical protein
MTRPSKGGCWRPATCRPAEPSQLGERYCRPEPLTRCGPRGRKGTRSAGERGCTRWGCRSQLCTKLCTGQRARRPGRCRGQGSLPAHQCAPVADGGAWHQVGGVAPAPGTDPCTHAQGTRLNLESVSAVLAGLARRVWSGKAERRVRDG